MLRLLICRPKLGFMPASSPGLFSWLFCSSRHTAITVTSAISVLVGASLGDLAGGDPSRFWALASCTALIVGGLGFIAWLAKAGVIVNFISESVLVGFKCGIALFIASTQLPKLFGFKGSHGDFWERSGYFFSHLRRNKHGVALTRYRRTRAATAGQTISQEQAGGPVRRHRRHSRCCEYGSRQPRA